METFQTKQPNILTVVGNLEAQQVVEGLKPHSLSKTTQRTANTIAQKPVSYPLNTHTFVATSPSPSARLTNLSELTNITVTPQI